MLNKNIFFKKTKLKQKLSLLRFLNRVIIFYRYFEINKYVVGFYNICNRMSLCSSYLENFLDKLKEKIIITSKN